MVVNSVLGDIMKKDDGNDLINILLTPENAAMFFGVLCGLPPAEREESVVSVLSQLYTQLHYGD